MTWYANEIMALATPEVLQAVRSNAQLAPFAYHLTNPQEWEWPDEAPKFPEEGLLVIRPTCDPTTPENVGDFFREPYLDWRDVRERPGFLPLIERERVVPELLGIAIEELPPVAFLSCIKELAANTGCVFVFYSCFMLMGDVEWEYAWIFRQPERVIACLRPKIPEANEVVCIMEPDEQNNIVAHEDTLKMSLIYLKTFLKTSFFPPHTRTFPWAKYKLAAAGGPTG